MSAEFRGRWVKRGGIMVPIPDPEPESRPVGRPFVRADDPVGRMVEQVEWTTETLNAAHAAYTRGSRDVLTLAGNREWRRRYKLARRRGRMTAADRAWCEKNATKSSWKQDEQTNRRASVSSINV